MEKQKIQFCLIASIMILIQNSGKKWPKCLNKESHSFYLSTRTQFGLWEDAAMEDSEARSSKNITCNMITGKE